MNLFSYNPQQPIEVFPQVFLLPQFADSRLLLRLIDEIYQAAPPRAMQTPWGKLTQAQMSNCGQWGWVSDRKGYRYAQTDPLSGKPWPQMPEAFRKLASKAAEAVGFDDFVPDACLINRYSLGAGMGAHQDRDEANFDWPIVSVSLGLTATFLIYGDSRRGKPLRVPLKDGDVLVWGGQSRLMYHGVAPLKTDPLQPGLRYRYNLTFRRAH